jgi:hypothetical protein
MHFLSPGSSLSLTAHCSFCFLSLGSSFFSALLPAPTKQPRPQTTAASMIHELMNDLIEHAAEMIGATTSSSSEAFFLSFLTVTFVAYRDVEDI